MTSATAPAEMLRRDFAVLDARETLRTTWTVEELILVQSVLGHAHEGHGVFRGRPYPNTTLDDVVRALRLDPMAVMGARQGLIDAIRAYAQSALAGTSARALVDNEGTPLLSVSTLRFLQAEPKEVLQGLYLGGLRDDPDVRAEVEQATGLQIGGGRSYFVDFSQLATLGITADELAHEAWEDRLDLLREEGIIVDAREADRPTVHYQYVRHRKGCGASDDAAIVAAGFVWGLGVALGVFLADAIDTLEKYVPRYSDQDAALARSIEAEATDLGVGREDVHRLIALSVAEDGKGKPLPDSSLRHLLSIDRTTDLCALEAHVLAVQGTPAPSIGLGHERIPSQWFYDVMWKRVREAAL